LFYQEKISYLHPTCCKCYFSCDCKSAICPSSWMMHFY